jgi:hypothetical protein
MASRSLLVGRLAREFLEAQDLATVDALLDVLNELRDNPDVDGLRKTHLVTFPRVERLWSDGRFWIRYIHRPDTEQVIIREIGRESATEP